MQMFVVGKVILLSHNRKCLLIFEFLIKEISFSDVGNL